MEGSAINQKVPDTERDRIFAELLQIPENKTCFDCSRKNATWASSSIGIFLCYQCTSVHRNMGVHITFVRSTKMDVWKAKEIKNMQLGGNKGAKEFYEKNNMYGTDGVPNHKSPALAKYKAELARKAEAALGV